MTSATRRPGAAPATADGTASAGVGMESGDVTRAGAGGITGCGTPEAKAASGAGAREIALFFEGLAAADKCRDVVCHHAKRLIVIGERASEVAFVAIGIAASQERQRTERVQ